MSTRNTSENKAKCVLCERQVAKTTRHHVIPRTNHRNKWFRKTYSREQMNHTIDLCRECHRGIHNFIPEKEMGRDFNSLEKLKNHPKVINLIAWLNRR